MPEVRRRAAPLFFLEKTLKKKHWKKDFSEFLETINLEEFYTRRPPKKFFPVNSYQKEKRFPAILNINTQFGVVHPKTDFTDGQNQRRDFLSSFLPSGKKKVVPSFTSKKYKFDIWSFYFFSNQFTHTVSIESDKFYQVHSINDFLHNQRNEYKSINNISSIIPSSQLKQSNIKNVVLPNRQIKVSLPKQISKDNIGQIKKRKILLSPQLSYFFRQAPLKKKNVSYTENEQIINNISRALSVGE